MHCSRPEGHAIVGDDEARRPRLTKTEHDAATIVKNTEKKNGWIGRNGSFKDLGIEMDPSGENYNQKVGHAHRSGQGYTRAYNQSLLKKERWYESVNIYGIERVKGNRTSSTRHEHFYTVLIVYKHQNHYKCCFTQSRDSLLLHRLWSKC